MQQWKELQILFTFLTYSIKQVLRLTNLPISEKICWLIKKSPSKEYYREHTRNSKENFNADIGT